MTMLDSSRPSATDRPSIPVLDVGEDYRALKTEFDAAYQRIMAGGWYILGPELESFEAEFASFCGVRHCAGVANGLEALQLILLACGIGPGDEVIVPAHTFIATWLAVSHCGARPVPVDVEPDTFALNPELLEAAVTPRTRAIVAVHLYGRPAPIDAIQRVAAAHRLKVVEDAAQAHGAMFNGRRAGALAHAAAFSFYPAKNLGAFGDGGAIVTDDPELLERVLALRNYGGRSKYLHATRGFNSRLDPLQAAFLRIKLKRLDEWNARRRAIARVYADGLRECGHFELPASVPGHVWHQYVIRHPRREAIQASLAELGVETAIHYPVPPHLSTAYSDLGLQRGAFPVTERIVDTVLSLPMGPHLSAAAAHRVVQALQAAANAHG